MEKLASAPPFLLGSSPLPASFCRRMVRGIGFHRRLDSPTAGRVPVTRTAVEPAIPPPQRQSTRPNVGRRTLVRKHGTVDAEKGRRDTQTRRILESKIEKWLNALRHHHIPLTKPIHVIEGNGPRSRTSRAIDSASACSVPALTPPPQNGR